MRQPGSNRIVESCTPLGGFAQSGAKQFLIARELYSSSKIEGNPVTKRNDEYFVFGIATPNESKRRLCHFSALGPHAGAMVNDEANGDTRIPSGEDPDRLLFSDIEAVEAL